MAMYPATATDERDRRGDSDGHESDEVGYIDSANDEHEANPAPTLRCGVEDGDACTHPH